MMKDKKAIVLFIEGFEEVEALTVVDFLVRAKVNVLKLGVNSILTKGRSGITIETDKLLEEINNFDEFDCLVIPGGPGAKNIPESPYIKNCLEHFFKNGKLVGAICAAPVVVLDALGFLQGRKFTCFTGLEKNVKDAFYQNQPVVVDGNLISSMAMGTSAEFADQLVTELVDAQTARLIAEDTRQFWIRS